uniref:Uncharacterized protein n=1 Tax=Manihot esculenta TaxID=3983 RepID=A0A2C9U5Q2_MANES
MVKGMRYVHSFGEVAPTLLISHRKSSSYPKLETIFEEVCLNNDNKYNSHKNLEAVVVPKRVVVLLPVILALAFYFLVNKYVDATS